MKLTKLWNLNSKKMIIRDSPQETSTENRKWTIEDIQAMFQNCSDIKIEKYTLGDREHPQKLYLIYCEGMADTQRINQYILPRLDSMLLTSEDRVESCRELELDRIEQHSDIVTRVFSGELIMYVPELNIFYSTNIANPPHRAPSESNIEVSIKGPKDGFVEELTSNVALIRKRLRTNSLCFEQFTIGSRSKSKVALLYMKDIINPDIVEEARNRLRNIDMDILFGSSQLEKILSDKSLSLFPLLDYSGRPDYVADCLVHGRFAVIADGSPTATIGPGNLTLLLKSPEDVYFPFYYASLGMFLRLIGLVMSLFVPGFWIALSAYNVEQIPYPLLATISLSRIGLPLPGPMEALLMIGMFELFREAGERLPKAVGQTVAVVGGIVVGDAAIRAGLASTTLLVVASITAVSSFTLVNQSLVGAVSIIRIFVLLCSSVLGMYGFVLSTIAIVLYLSRLESYGVPFLAPLSPLTWKDVLAAISRVPWNKANYRPKILNTTDSTRGGDDSNE